MSQEDEIDYGTDNIVSGGNQADVDMTQQTETPAQAARESAGPASTSSVDPLDVDQGDAELYSGDELHGDDPMGLPRDSIADDELHSADPEGLLRGFMADDDPYGDGSLRRLPRGFMAYELYDGPIGFHAQAHHETGRAEDNEALEGNHVDSPAQQTPAGAALGAAPEEDEDPMAWTRLPVAEHQCGNCDEMGHSVSVYLWPVDEQGFLSGCCPFCNTRRHDVFDCPLETKPADFFHFLVERRSNRPVIPSSMELWEIDPERWQKFEGDRPWTPEFVKKNMELLRRTDPRACQADANWPVDPSWTTTKGTRARPANLMLPEHLRRRMAMPPIVMEQNSAQTMDNSKKRTAEAPPEGAPQSGKRQQTAPAQDMRLFFNSLGQSQNGQATRGGRGSRRGPSTQSVGRGARRGGGPQRGRSARRGAQRGGGPQRGQPAGRGARRGGFSQRDESAQPVDRPYHPRRDTGFAAPAHPTRVRKPFSYADDEIYPGYVEDDNPTEALGGRGLDYPMGSSRNPPTQQRRTIDTRPSMGFDRLQEPTYPEERAARIDNAVMVTPEFLARFAVEVMQQVQEARGRQSLLPLRSPSAPATSSATGTSTTSSSR